MGSIANKLLTSLVTGYNVWIIANPAIYLYLSSNFLDNFDFIQIFLAVLNFSLHGGGGHLRPVSAKATPLSQFGHEVHRAGIMFMYHDLCGRGNINSYLGSNLWFTVDPFGFHGVPKWWLANFVYEVQQGLAIVVLMLVLRIWYFQLPQATTNAIAGLKLLRQPASI